MIDSLSDGTLASFVGFGGGLILGLAARLGRFCTLGAIEDALYAGSDSRLRMWGVAIGAAIIGTFALVGFGWLELGVTLYHAQLWSPVLSVFGGLTFGFGMAMAGNCGFGALARLGGGDLRSFVIVLVMGITALITVSGPLAPLRVAIISKTAVTPDPPGFAGLLGSAAGVETYVAGILLGMAILGVTLAKSEFRREFSAIFWGLAVGLAIVSGWGGSQWIARNGFDEITVLSHTFSAPLGDTLIYLMTSSGGGIGFGVGSVFGVIFGAFAGSLIKGHFRWEACEDPRELKRQISGAALMGVGAVLALGCTIGQGISAFSVLAFSAPLVFVSIFVGAAFGLRYLITGSLAFR